MKEMVYCMSLLVIIGLVVGYLLAHKPTLARNEANGTVHPARFSGYKASLKTTVNQGTPLYGETAR